MPTNVCRMQKVMSLVNCLASCSICSVKNGHCIVISKISRNNNYSFYIELHVVSIGWLENGRQNV
jgi:hypothetical protein